MMRTVVRSVRRAFQGRTQQTCASTPSATTSCATRTGSHSAGIGVTPSSRRLALQVRQEALLRAGGALGCRLEHLVAAVHPGLGDAEAGDGDDEQRGTGPEPGR